MSPSPPPTPVFLTPGLRRREKKHKRIRTIHDSYPLTQLRWLLAYRRARQHIKEISFCYPIDGMGRGIMLEDFFNHVRRQRRLGRPL